VCVFCVCFETIRAGAERESNEEENFFFVFSFFCQKKKEVWAVGGFLRREERSPSAPKVSLFKSKKRWRAT